MDGSAAGEFGSFGGDRGFRQILGILRVHFCSFSPAAEAFANDFADFFWGLAGVEGWGNSFAMSGAPIRRRPRSKLQGFFAVGWGGGRFGFGMGGAPIWRNPLCPRVRGDLPRRGRGAGLTLFVGEGLELLIAVAVGHAGEVVAGDAVRGLVGEALLVAVGEEVGVFEVGLEEGGYLVAGGLDFGLEGWVEVDVLAEEVG